LFIHEDSFGIVMLDGCLRVQRISVSRRFSSSSRGPPEFPPELEIVHDYEWLYIHVCWHRGDCLLFLPGAREIHFE